MHSYTYQNLDIDSPKNIKLHSTSAVSMPMLLSAEKIINKAIEDLRLKRSGMSAEAYDKIASDVDVKATIDTESGSKEGSAGAAYLVSFACGILIYMMMIIYGTQVMRGVSGRKDKPHCRSDRELCKAFPTDDRERSLVSALWALHNLRSGSCSLWE